jgi:hypothetical protein
MDKAYGIILKMKFKKILSWDPVTHACNPNYLGGRNEEDFGLRPAQANSL